jgi:hypothetical protein
MPWDWRNNGTLSMGMLKRPMMKYCTNRSPSVAFRMISWRIGNKYNEDEDQDETEEGENGGYDGIRTCDPRIMSAML